MQETPQRVTEYEVMELLARRIDMADGRYMIFFTFERPAVEETGGDESDV